MAAVVALCSRLTAHRYPPFVFFLFRNLCVIGTTQSGPAMTSASFSIEFKEIHIISDFGPGRCAAIFVEEEEEKTRLYTCVQVRSERDG